MQVRSIGFVGHLSRFAERAKHVLFALAILATVVGHVSSASAQLAIQTASMLAAAQEMATDWTPNWTTPLDTVVIEDRNTYVVEDDTMVCRTLEVAEARARTAASYWDNFIDDVWVSEYLAAISKARTSACSSDWSKFQTALGELDDADQAISYEFSVVSGIAGDIPEAQKRFYKLTNAMLTSLAQNCGGGQNARGVLEYILARSSAPIDFMGRPHSATGARGVASMAIEAKYQGAISFAAQCPEIPRIPSGIPGGSSPTSPMPSRAVSGAFNNIPSSSIGCYQSTGGANDCSPLATDPKEPPPPPEDDKEEARRKDVIVHKNPDGSTTIIGPVQSPTELPEITIVASNDIPNTGEGVSVPGAVRAIGGLVSATGTIMASSRDARTKALGEVCKVVGAGIVLVASAVEQVVEFCSGHDCSGTNIYQPGMLCPLFRAGGESNPVFIGSPTGLGGLTSADAFEMCSCNAGNNLGRCTTDLLVRNKCYFDPLVSSGGASFAEDVCVDVLYTDNPWLNKPAIRDGYCYVLDCPPGQDPVVGGGTCSCGSSTAGLPLPPNWNICIAAMCPFIGDGCLCM